MIKNVTAKFAATDFGEENARYERATERLEEVEAAIDKANARRNEITRRLSDFHAPNGEEIAAALLNGKSAAEAAADRSSADELRAERESLSSAVRVLDDEAHALRVEMQDIRCESLVRLREDTQAVIDALTTEARAAAQRIAGIFADLSAIQLGLQYGTREKTAASTAVEGLMGSLRLLPRSRRIDVRPEIVAMIAVLADKGPAVHVKRTSSVAAP
ncbi:hypothetical protein [Sphingopyxis flava]|uniref:hypothetical protein n=1 Tax=Sphingopyxis flava TaxID=1507287 RepID=UPI001116C3B0|nr:hypothetical protein [Sphingopyxis flava]